MNKSILSAFLLLIATFTSAYDIQMTSGLIPLPDIDGSFLVETTEGYPVRHVYSILSPEKFSEYVNSPTTSEDIFADYIADSPDLNIFFDETTEDGYIALFSLYEYIDDEDWWGYNEDACFACVFIYENQTQHATNYIARAVKTHTPASYAEDDNGWGLESELKILDIATKAGRWNVISPTPVEIECTGIAVSGGVVTATYQLSDFSRLNEIADGNTITFTVATSLNRDQDGAIATTTLAGTITATDSAASTVTVTLTPPASATSFFILGTAD